MWSGYHSHLYYAAHTHRVVCIFIKKKKYLREEDSNRLHDLCGSCVETSTALVDFILLFLYKRNEECVSELCFVCVAVRS